MVANHLKKTLPELKTSTANEIKAWFKKQDKEATYYHRHYVEDKEYIPYNREATDKEAYINSVLAKEIDYQILSWTEYVQLGYEILPNKYFYIYKEPKKSDVLIEQFWELEREAEDLLTQIREL